MKTEERIEFWKGKTEQLKEVVFNVRVGITDKRDSTVETGLLIEQYAKRYATECIKASLEKAANNAKTDDFFDQRNCETKTSIDKSSITDSQNIVLL